MIRVLVTGAGSFTARHLRPLLEARPDATVVWTDRAEALPGGTEVASDLTDRASVREMVIGAHPDIVIHLAGAPGTDPESCHRVNFDGTRHLLDACAEQGAATRFLLVSTAAVYGLTRPEESPVREDTPLRPVTAYGVSKAAAELAAMALHRRRRLRVRVVRPFNLVGPGLGPGFAASDFITRALALRERGRVGEVTVGALEPSRDFIDVRDAVRAYVALAMDESEWGETFNVASGRPVRIGDLLEAVAGACGVRVRPAPDPALRRIEVMEQIGNPSALRAATGWHADIPLERSLGDMVADRS